MYELPWKRKTMMITTTKDNNGGKGERKGECESCLSKPPREISHRPGALYFVERCEGCEFLSVCSVASRLTPSRLSIAQRWSVVLFSCCCRFFACVLVWTKFRTSLRDGNWSHDKQFGFKLLRISRSSFDWLICLMATF